MMPAALQLPEVDVEQLSELSGVIRWTGVIASVGVVVAALLVLKLVNGAVERMSDSFAQWRMFLHKARALVHFAVYLGTGALVILLSFRLSGPLLTFLGGTAAVALGFAFKDLVASLVGGITIMIDRPFQVGDRVSFGGYYGDITSIGLRSVRLQTLDDNTVTVPNSKFISDITSCGNYGALDMMVLVTFYVGVDQDVRRARELFREIALTSRYVYLAKNVDVTASQVQLDNCVAVKLTLKAYVLDIKYEKAMETDITLRVLETFAQRGIQAPAVLHRTAEDVRAAPGSAGSR
jgi:small-conductance mechanosensitive channel